MECNKYKQETDKKEVNVIINKTQFDRFQQRWERDVTGSQLTSCLAHR